MLKKAGILTAAIAASMLAVSPLAFAGGADHDSKSDHKSDKKRHDKDDDDNDGHKKDRDHHKKKKHDGDDDDKDRHHKKDRKKHDDPKQVISTDNQSTDCRFAAAGSANSSATRNAGLLGLAGIDVVGSIAGNVIGQVPIASCNNIDVSDVIDLNSNNRTTTVTPAPAP